MTTCRDNVKCLESVLRGGGSVGGNVLSASSVHSQTIRGKSSTFFFSMFIRTIHVRMFVSGISVPIDA